MVKERKAIHTNDEKKEIHRDDSDGKIKKKLDQYAWEKFYYMALKYFNVILAVTFALSVYYYVESLRGCFGTQAECLKELNEGEVRALLGMLSKSGFILAGTVFLIMSGLASKLFFPLILVVYGYLCLYHDVGSDLGHHGSYNRVVLVGFFFVWFLGITLVFFTVKGLRTQRVITVFLLFVAFSSVWLFYRVKVKNSCRDWDRGLKDTRIDNSNMPCKIIYPEQCWIDVLEGWLDYSGWLNEKCEVIRNGDRTLYDKYFYEKNPNYTPAKRFGFPRTENYTYGDCIHSSVDYKILREMIDMDDPSVPQEVKDKTDIIVDYTKEESFIDIKVHRDEKLVSQRLPLYKRLGKNLIAKNLLIVYIDAISRRNFLRKMKKTTEWLEKYYRTNDTKISSYQFLKYHSLGFFTQINTIPAFQGKWWLEAGGNPFIKYWKEKGGISAQINGVCARELYDWDNNQYKHFNWEPYDHEYFALSCDPNYNQADNPYTPFLGPYSVRRRCLHGKDLHEYEIEIANKFWDTYKDLPKVLRLGFIDAHEGSLEVVKYLDERLANFLSEMETSKKLDDTVVLFMADHGNNMPGFIKMMDSEDYEIERYTPMMFMVIPEKLRKTYGEAIFHNEQTLITPWDIHNTLLHLGGAPLNAYNPHGSSFLKKISNDRFSCRKMLIREDYCKCK